MVSRERGLIAWLVVLGFIVTFTAKFSHITAVGDAYVFPGFLTRVLTQLFSPKPQTSFLTYFSRGDQKVRLDHQLMSPARSPLRHTGRTERGPSLVNSWIEIGRV